MSVFRELLAKLAPLARRATVWHEMQVAEEGVGMGMPTYVLLRKGDAQPVRQGSHVAEEGVGKGLPTYVRIDCRFDIAACINQ